MTDRLIDVDGYRLAVRVTGSQGPAVVMLSSAGGGHEQWEQLRARLSDTLCVSYGRPGIDGSDPPPPDQQGVPRTASWPADHLHTLLHAAQIPQPYVLVGSSIGGWIADQFTAAWPGEVAGLVQVDATSITPIPRAHREETFDDAEHGGSTSPGPRPSPSSSLLPHRYRGGRWSSPKPSAACPSTSSSGSGGH